jgi:hypothetical protein
MSAQVTCPVCKTKYTVADNLLGKTIPCRKCQESFVATAVDDVPTVLAVDDDESAPTVRPAGSPLLLVLLGAGVAVVLVGALGVVAYLFWPEERQPVVVQASPPPPAPRSRPSRPQTRPAPKEQPKEESPFKPVPTDAPKDQPKSELREESPFKPVPNSESKDESPFKPVPKTESKDDSPFKPVPKTEPKFPTTPAEPKSEPKPDTAVARAPDVPKSPSADVKPSSPPAADVSPVALVPDSPLVAAIHPPDLASDHEPRFLPAPAGDMCVAAAGRYLLVALPRNKQLAVFDVNEAKIVKTLPLSEAATKVVAGASVIVAYNPDGHTLERWTLPSFRKDGPVPAPLAQPVYALALGSASDGPLLTTAGNDAKRFGGGLRFLDPMTFREVSIKPVDRASEFGFRAGKGSMMRASADGRVFTTWTPGDRDRGPQSLVVTGPRFKVSVETEPAGHVVPAPDGQLLFTGRGVATVEGRPTTGTPDGLSMPSVPAVHGPSYLCVEPADKTATINLMVLGRAAPLRVWKFELLAPVSADSTNAIPPDRRVVFIPAAKLLVTLPASNDRLVLHKLDLPAAPPKTAALTISSVPPPIVSRGSTVTYAITAHPPGQSLTFRLEEGPPGLTVSSDGVVTWPVPATQPLALVPIRIRVRSATGAEAIHAFRLGIQDQVRSLSTPK